jgi:CMP-N,N'-diacetyllegionaminic acid synthase
MILDLDVTSPLRNVSDLLNAYEKIIKDPQALNLFSVSKANRNPYFNMVEKKENGYYALVKENSVLVKARQSAPKVFDLNASFYFYKRKFFDQDFKSAITEKSMIYEMPHTCFDLDEPIDFELMDYFLENNKH